jgi:hypothetical protein
MECEEGRMRVSLRYQFFSVRARKGDSEIVKRIFSPPW